MLYPKIGIRPVIDGRWGGVRESLENQTVTMANNAAKLISGTLRYPDGKPVECVVGCTTIGGGAEAARVAEQFSTQKMCIRDRYGMWRYIQSAAKFAVWLTHGLARRPHCV